MTSDQAIQELARKAEQDASLREALRNAQSVEEVVKLAAGAGVTVSAEQIQSFQAQSPKGELSEADLEKVAGGTFLGDFSQTLGDLGGRLYRGGQEFGDALSRSLHQVFR